MTLLCVSVSVSLLCEESFPSFFDAAPHILPGVPMPAMGWFLFMLRSLYLRLGRPYFHEREDQEGGLVLDWIAWRCAMVFLTGYAGVLGDLCSIW